VLKIKRHFTRQVRADNSRLHRNYTTYHFCATQLFLYSLPLRFNISLKKNILRCIQIIRVQVYWTFLSCYMTWSVHARMKSQYREISHLFEFFWKVIFYLFSPPHHSFSLLLSERTLWSKCFSCVHRKYALV